MDNKYLEKLALLTPNIFKSSIKMPKVFNSYGRAMVKKPIGTTINSNISIPSIREKSGIKVSNLKLQKSSK